MGPTIPPNFLNASTILSQGLAGGRPVAEIRASLAPVDVAACPPLFRPQALLLDRFQRGQDLEAGNLAILSDALTASPRDTRFKDQFHYIEENGASRDCLAALGHGLDRTDFLKGHEKKMRTLVNASLVGQISAGFVADYVWRLMAVDHGGKIPGATVTITDGTVQIECDESAYRPIDAISLPMRLGDVDQILNRSLSLVESKDGRLTLRFPPLQAFESAINQLYGSDSARWEYKPGRIPRDDLNLSHLKQRQPIGLSLIPLMLGDVNAVVHPFVFAFHDLYHAVRVAILPLPLRTMAAGLYVAVNGLEPELRALPFVESMLDTIADLHLDHQTSAGLLDVAFQPFKFAKIQHPRFLHSLHEAWKPYIHESRTESVATYLAHLLPLEDVSERS